MALFGGRGDPLQKRILTAAPPSLSFSYWPKIPTIAEAEENSGMEGRDKRGEQQR
jgi:hypothetical protein